MIRTQSIAQRNKIKVGGVNDPHRQFFSTIFEAMELNLQKRQKYFDNIINPQQALNFVLKEKLRNLPKFEGSKPETKFRLHNN